MIDAISIFTKGGVVLWSYYFIKLKGDPIDSLIKNVLLEEKSYKSHEFFGSFNLKWKLINEFNLVMVIVYQGLQQLVQLDSLLDSVTAEFINFIGSKNNIYTPRDYSAFNERFLKLAKKFQHTSENFHQSNTHKIPDTKKQINSGSSAIHTKIVNQGLFNPTKPKVNGLSENDNEDEDDSSHLSHLKRSNSKGIQANNTVEATRSNSKNTNSKLNGSKGKNIESEKKSKKNTTWDFIKERVSAKEIAALDFSRTKGSQETTLIPDYGISSEINMSTESDSSELDDDSSQQDYVNHPLQDSAKANKGNFYLKKPKIIPRSSFSSFFSSVNSIFQNFTGNMILTSEELTVPLSEFKSTLMIKNVAEEVADMITESVKASLIGDKSTSFTSAREMVKRALNDSIQKILTPNKSIDVLRDALAAKEKQEVYSIVFMGVNGVGKSTNLAKVCYYLKKRGGLKVMIVACDTFRSGAVEQLKFHAKHLDVHLFERGYGKDAAHIAQESLKYAQNNGYDVVLIDTAGRMQDNTPLMKSLSKLISLNNPNLILFVGEALVGNDGIDQLKKFNQCLTDMSDLNKNRNIDGILLTKFDTVDDKVGAALSMTYITGQPIVFVGVGQKYPDLKRLNARTCVNALLN